MEQAVISENNHILWQLSDHALTEAASDLAALTGSEVTIRLLSLGLTHLRGATQFFTSGEPRVIAVNQRVHGLLDGLGSLLLNEACAMAFVREILREKARLNELTQLEEEALTEAGNIVMNSCLGNYAQLLQGRLGCDLPVLQRGHFSQMLQIYAVQAKQNEFFYVKTHLATASTSCQALLLWDRTIWDSQPG